MAWGCKHSGPCGWSWRNRYEWWCEVCDRGGPLEPETEEPS